MKIQTLVCIFIYNVLTVSAKESNFTQFILNNNGYINPSINIHNFEGYGNGILATHDLQEGEILFDIPQSIILTQDNILGKYERNSDLTITLEELSDEVIIALELMKECLLGQDSGLYEYVAVLPGQISRMDTFTEEELDELQDNFLKEQALQSHQELFDIYHNTSSQNLSQVVMGMLQVSFENNRMNNSRMDKYKMNSYLYENCLSFKAFHHFVAVVGSRAMVLKGQRFLVPLPDMLNHAPRSNSNDNFCDISFDSKPGATANTRNFCNSRLDQLSPPFFSSNNKPFDLYHYQLKNGRMRVKTDRWTAAGSQVFEEYSTSDNSLYLDRFGFIPYDNPFHCASVDLSQSYSANVKELLYKLQLISHESLGRYDGFLAGEAVCVYRDGTIHANDLRGKALISVLALEKDDVNRNRCLHIVDSSNFDFETITMNCIRYPGHQVKTKELLKELAIKTLKSKPTSIEYDEQLILEFVQNPNIDMESNRNVRIALEFRLFEKRLLQDISSLITSSILTVQHTTAPSDYHQLAYSNDLKENAVLEDGSSFKEAVDDLNRFVAENSRSMNIKASVVGNGLRLGVVAIKNIEKGDIYTSISNEIILSVNSVPSEPYERSTSGVLNIVQTLKGGFDDEFHSLLFLLLHERYVAQSSSKWWPYLRLLPTLSEQQANHPLWISADSLDLLSGSDLRSDILKYQRQASNAFDSFLSEESILNHFGEHFTRSNYLWAHSILDSRSIWWNDERHLVPLLDLVNCSPHISTVHKTELSTDDGLFAETRAGVSVRRGEQLFENYGQPNNIYFKYHGFVLANNNKSDCVLFNNIQIRQTNIGPKRLDEIKQQLHIKGFHSFNPHFCISSAKESLDSLSEFLRIRDGIVDGYAGFSDEIKPAIQAIIQDRLDRYHHRNKFCSDYECNGLSRIESAMVLFVQNEQSILQSILDSLEP